jgi:signal transduction histidine kinase/CheY-like chemotaxis protein
MAIDLSRGLYSIVLNKLPRHLRSFEDYFFFSFMVASIMILALTTPLLVYIGLWQPMGPWRPVWSTSLCALVILGLLALWRAGLSIPWLQNFFQATLLTIIFYNAYYTGGVTSPVMVWIGLVPVLPQFIVSRRWSYIWLIIAFVFVVGVYLAQIQGLFPSNVVINQQALTLSALMIGMLCIAQVMIVTIYTSANTQHIRSIERNNLTLQNLSQDLQQAHDHKDKFLTTVSHEMRTPLNALMGYLGLLRTTDQLPTVASSYVQGAQNSAAHLLTVINDLLDFSQIQQGKLVLSPQTFHLAQVLQETHDTLAPRAAEQALNFSLQLEDNLPPWVRTDPHRLKQIFLNLLGNALKFTHHGSVTTRVRFEADLHDAQRGVILLIVHDTGMGIPSQHLERIFEPFVQVHEQNTMGNDNALRGNGLGLSITQNLVANLGGSIRLDSQVGVGSTFEVRLPIEIAKPPQAIKVSPAKEVYPGKIYLLLVDDHATNRLVTSATIKRDVPNAIIDEARNGTEAIQKMKTNAYDLVLMDLIMPDYSGVEVTRIIRTECAPPLSQVHVVALTANVAEAAVKECLEVGIHEVLRKPFERDVMIRTILQHAT